MRNPGEVVESNPIYRPRVNIVVGIPDGRENSIGLSDNRLNSSQVPQRTEVRRFVDLRMKRQDSVSYEGVKKQKKIIFFKDTSMQTNEVGSFEIRYMLFYYRQNCFSILSKEIIMKSKPNRGEKIEVTIKEKTTKAGNKQNELKVADTINTKFKLVRRKAAIVLPKKK
jgi:hypothetical protein